MLSKAYNSLLGSTTIELLSLMAESHPPFPALKGDPSAGDCVPLSRNEAAPAMRPWDVAYSSLSAQNTVKSRSAAVLSEEVKPSKSFKVFS